MTICRVLSLFLLSLFTAHAQFSLPFGGEEGADGSGAAKTSASLIAENRTIAPGKPFTVLLELKHPQDWHSYFINPGSVGLVPEIKWSLPAGFTHGPIQWPTPHLSDSAGIKLYAYEGTVRLPVLITPPAGLAPDTKVELKADATWQICSDTGCIQENAPLKLSLPVTAQAEPNPDHAKTFESARNALPLASKDWTASASRKGKSITLTLKANTPGAPEPKELYIFEKDGQISGDSPQTVTWKDGTAEVKLTVSDDAKPIDTFSAIAYAANGWDKDAPQKGLLIDAIPFNQTSGSAKESSEAMPARRLIGILGLMLVGGLILNLMPCVFPVIGLKILGFVQQAGSDRRKVVIHGLVFSLGVYLSFAILSGLLFTVRETVGWGFQLQDPRFVLAMLLLMFVMALNMAGIFEIGASATSVGGNLANKQGFAGSFFSGVLATLIATPCAGPFLGTAIGVAIKLPAVPFFASFAAMAIGLTLPYLILSAFPKLTDLLPRPGAWMESFKQGMSFLLFATAGYLLWTYLEQIVIENGQAAMENALLPILGLSVIALAAWIYGRWSVPYRKAKTRWIARIVAALTLTAGLWMIKVPKPSGLHWQHWSQQSVDAALAENKPVFVDFTASWCFTCQTNKKIAYTQDVIKQMNDLGIVTFKADKSKPDAVIEAKLRELGRTAIPVNVLYIPGKEPIITNPVLTPGYLSELFTKEVPKK